MSEGKPKIINLSYLMKTAAPVAKDTGECFIVSNNHLNAILCNAPLLSNKERNIFLRNLAVLNALAFNELYPKEAVDLIAFNEYAYKKPTEEYTVLQSLKLLDCLEYNIRNLRNHDEYPDFKRIAAIKDQLIRLIPGYNVLRWSIK